VTTTDPDRCDRCGRLLRSALALAAGYGPTCALRALGERPRRRHRIPDEQLALDLPEKESAA
jgi:hypothetical protein